VKWAKDNELGVAEHADSAYSGTLDGVKVATIVKYGMDDHEWYWHTLLDPYWTSGNRDADGYPAGPIHATNTLRDAKAEVDKVLADWRPPAP
jgi:hypothetical protein